MENDLDQASLLQTLFSFLSYFGADSTQKVNKTLLTYFLYNIT